MRRLFNSYYMFFIYYFVEFFSGFCQWRLAPGHRPLAGFM
ncbi:hypothetical protein RHECNPAF_1260060 [Rhizobium etli CNPAF512]|nr:hypothetical protein RHECNPAF_1260060 [Rhizobium etli CNPAF512]